jgi:hypothetical protein
MCLIHTLVITSTINEILPIENSGTCTLIYLERSKGQIKVKCYKCKTCMCFIKTVILACIIYEILPFENSIALIWLLNVIHGQILYDTQEDHMWLTISDQKSLGKPKTHVWNTNIHMFVYTLIINFKIYEIPPFENWMTFIWP